MTGKVFSIRLDEQTIADIEQLTASMGLSKPELIRQAVAMLKSAPFSTNVPVGAKLPTSWELKPHLVEAGSVTKWLVFPEELVVAVVEKSANGSQKYLRVCKEYPEAVWQIAKASKYWQPKPATTLELTQVKYFHPTITQARELGWSIRHSAMAIFDLEYLLEEAEEFILNSTATLSSPVDPNDASNVPASRLSMDAS